MVTNDNDYYEDTSHKRPTLSNGIRASSLKDMRHLLPPNHALATSRKLSTSYELIEPVDSIDGFSEFSDTPRSSSFSSDEEAMSYERSYYAPSMSHAKSCDNLSSSVPSYLSQSKSFDNLISISPSINNYRLCKKRTSLTSSALGLADRNERNAAEEHKVIIQSLHHGDFLGIHSSCP